MRWLEGITSSNGHELGQTLEDGERQRPGMLQSTGSQRVGHDSVAEQQQHRVNS